mgnify:FL=1|jgi:hypothetical protein
MKCLKSSKTGNIIRVSDKEAYNATSEWKFIPKSEWKADRRPAKKVEEVIVEVQEQTIAEKQLNKKKKDK